jgi:hypothetical protein
MIGSAHYLEFSKTNNKKGVLNERWRNKTCLFPYFLYVGCCFCFSLKLDLKGEIVKWKIVNVRAGIVIAARKGKQISNLRMNSDMGINSRDPNVQNANNGSETKSRGGIDGISKKVSKAEGKENRGAEGTESQKRNWRARGLWRKKMRHGMQKTTE